MFSKCLIITSLINSNKVEWADTINEENERPLPFEKQPLLRSESRLSEKSVTEALQGGEFPFIFHASLQLLCFLFR